MANFSILYKGLLSKYYFSTVAIITLIIANSTAFAGSYTTRTNGNWSAPTTWTNYQVAPDNINYQDVVEINNVVNAQDLKINNGGTMYINKQLNAQEITLNGPDSRLIVERGAVLNVQNVQGNSENIIYKDAQSPLPVTLVYFNLQNTAKSRKNNTLVWKTAQELNNSHFVVESSLDARNFEEAGRVTGTNSASGAMYKFEHAIAAAKIYYRLKQVDFDGKASYSPIILAEKEVNLQVISGSVTFGSAFNGKIRLVNLAGQEILQTQLNQASYYQFPENLRGHYIMQVETLNQVNTQRIAL